VLDSVQTAVSRAKGTPGGVMLWTRIVRAIETTTRLIDHAAHDIGLNGVAPAARTKLEQSAGRCVPSHGP
jgi:hypothetical protein